MPDAVNLSLDEIIKQNRTSRSRGRGNGNVRGESRGASRGRGAGRGGRVGRGGRGQAQASQNGRNGRSRSRSRSRSRGPNARSQSRGRSQPRGRFQSRGRLQTRGRPYTRGRSQSRARSMSQSQERNRSQSRTRSRSRQRTRSNSRARSASRSRQFRGLTPKGRAGLEDQLFDMPPLARGNRGGVQTRLRRLNSNTGLQGSVHSRLGINTRRGSMGNRPLAFAKRGISKRGRGLSTRNRYSSVGLRSDRILQEQRQNMVRNNNVIQSQIFTRSRNNSFSSSGAQLTVSVANDFAKKRRNSFSGTNYLNKQSLNQLNNEYTAFNVRRGPASVKSVGSNQSNSSRRSAQSRGRGRGRGRGVNRGVSRNFANKRVLNPRLQQEIAAIQGKTEGSARSERPAGVELNYTPTPSATVQTLHQRFAHV